MMTAFGVVIPDDLITKGVRDDAEHLVDEHPYISSGAAVAGAIATRKTVRVGRAARFSHVVVAKPERAAKLAADLHPHRSADIMSPDALREQGAVYRNARRTNPDAARFQPTAEHYSRQMKVARQVREAANRPEHARGLRAVVHPIRAEHELHARNITGMIDAAQEGAHPELHRAMHIAHHHKVGDEVDFGRLSSWTSSEQMAHLHNSGVAMHDAFVPPSKKYAPEGTKAVIYHLPEGSTKAVNISGAVKGFAQNEWLTGGKYRVAGVEHKDGVTHYRLGPHHGPMATNAFGVAS